MCKPPSRRIVAGAAALVLAATVSACADDGDATDASSAPATADASSAPANTATSTAPSATAPEPGDVGQRAIDDISRTFEGERMAHDLYSQLHEAWGQPRFERFADAGQRHLDALTAQMDRLGIMRAAVMPEPGVYADPEVQALYDAWLDRGSSSEREALAVGIELEERAIAELEGIIARTEDAELAGAFGYLLDGARSHRDSLRNGLEGGGGG